MTKLTDQFSKVKANDVGVLGDPVAHSLSPLIHNVAFKIWAEAFHEQDHEMPVYHKFHVRKEELEDAVHILRQKKLRGCNITVPHKISIGRYVDQWDPVAQRLGSINTLVFKNDLLIGYNTDGDGFRRALEWDLGLSMAEKKVVVLGAGGTGRVISHMLVDMQVSSLALWNRTLSKADELLKEFKDVDAKLHTIVTDDDLRRRVKEADLIVNTTSVGLKENEGLPAPFLEFHPGQVAFDVIYHRETAFLREAKRNGAHVSGGEGMFLYQGALAFEIWTGSPAPVDAMRDVLQKNLNKGI